MATDFTLRHSMYTIKFTPVKCTVGRVMKNVCSHVIIIHPKMFPYVPLSSNPSPQSQSVLHILLPFLECDIHGITKCIVSGSWLPSFGMMILRSIQLAACTSSSFTFIAEQCPVTQMYLDLLFHSPIDKIIRSFPLFGDYEESYHEPSHMDTHVGMYFISLG